MATIYNTTSKPGRTAFQHRLNEFENELDQKLHDLHRYYAAEVCRLKLMCDFDVADCQVVSSDDRGRRVSMKEDRDADNWRADDWEEPCEIFRLPSPDVLPPPAPGNLKRLQEPDAHYECCALEVSEVPFSGDECPNGGVRLTVRFPESDEGTACHATDIPADDASDVISSCYGADQDPSNEPSNVRPSLFVGSGNVGDLGVSPI